MARPKRLRVGAQALRLPGPDIRRALSNPPLPAQGTLPPFLHSRHRESARLAVPHATLSAAYSAPCSNPSRGTPTSSSTNCGFSMPHSRIVVAGKARYQDRDARSQQLLLGTLQDRTHRGLLKGNSKGACARVSHAATLCNASAISSATRRLRSLAARRSSSALASPRSMACATASSICSGSAPLSAASRMLRVAEVTTMPSRIRRSSGPIGRSVAPGHAAWSGLPSRTTVAGSYAAG